MMNKGKEKKYTGNSINMCIRARVLERDRERKGVREGERKENYIEKKKKKGERERNEE